MDRCPHCGCVPFGGQFAKQAGSKGGRATRGDKKRHGKLDWEKVHRIRADVRSSAEVARDFDIAPSTVREIRAYKRWRSDEAGT
jgi:DNA invertase Pin-like site-specific DNA recombinase